MVVSLSYIHILSPTTIHMVNGDALEGVVHLANTIFCEPLLRRWIQMDSELRLQWRSISNQLSTFLSAGDCRAEELQHLQAPKIPPLRRLR
jgi:hypothetical protein